MRVLVMANGHGCLRVVLDFTPEFAFMCTGRLQVAKVALNLVSTCIDAMGDAGVASRFLDITVRTADAQAAGASVRASGFGEAALQDGFGSFLATKPSDLVSGLPFLCGIVEAHGGWLWVEPNAATAIGVPFMLPFWQ